MKKLIGAVILVLIMAGGVFAIPDAISYQGRVFEMPGGTNPVPDAPGNSVVVRIYDMFSGGVPLYTMPQKNDIQTIDGYFNMEISGAGAAGLLFDTDYWIEIDFNDETMFPRQHLTTAPYAGRAVYVDMVSPFPDSTIYGPQQVTAEAVGIIAMLGSNSQGIGIQGEGVTGVAAVSNEDGGIGLYVKNTGMDSIPMFVEGGGAAILSGPGLTIDSGAYPAALFVSFTAGAWPAALINAPNGQALQINGSPGGMNKPILDVDGDISGGKTVAIHGAGGTNFGFGGAGVSGTAKNGTGVYGQGVTGVAAVADVPEGTAIYATGGSSLFEGMVTITTTTPFGGALNVYNDAGTGQGLYVRNNPGAAILSQGDIGLRGEGTMSGVEGIGLNGSSTGVFVQNDFAKGDDSGSALYVKGKIRIGPGSSSASPSGAINLAAGINPFFSVGNVLCNGGAYRVLVTPQNPVTAVGNPCSWWVEKQDGNFIIHIESGGAPTDNDVVFDYLIINN